MISFAEGVPDGKGNERVTSAACVIELPKAKIAAMVKLILIRLNFVE